MRIRFNVQHVERAVPSDPRLDELKEWCARFHHHGLAPPLGDSSLGNLSFRLKKGDDSFIITASETGMKDCLPDDAFVTVHGCDCAQGVVRASGMRNPSSESILHFEIYRRRPDVHAIFHGHSEVILSSAGRLALPETSREDPYGSSELIASVLTILDDLWFFIMKGHGFVALGKTMTEAGDRTLAIYERAHYRRE